MIFEHKLNLFVFKIDKIPREYINIKKIITVYFNVLNHELETVLLKIGLNTFNTFY